MASKLKLFLYGTLKRGQCRASAMDGQVFLGEAETTPEYTMYSVRGSYPALVQSGANSIQGELWEIDEKCRQVLDAIEGAPSLYKLTPVNLKSHPDDKCFTYIFQQRTSSYEDCGVCWK